jgi:hypothetical protein
LKQIVLWCLGASLLSFGACRKADSTPEKKLDACALLTKQEIETVQGSPITETRTTDQSGQGFRVSQCYFGAEQTSESVSLVVTQSDPDQPVKRTPKDYWRDTFTKHPVARERDRESEEREPESATPEKIEGLGDDAYWLGNRVGGALYAIKNKTLIRLSLGGPDDQKTKIDKSKTLARKALDRL